MYFFCEVIWANGMGWLMFAGSSVELKLDKTFESLFVQHYVVR